MKSIVIALTLGMFFSCGTKKITGNGEGQTIKMKAMHSKAELGKIPVHSDAVSPETIAAAAVSIESAKIKGNMLILKISYAGGCAEHDFKLVGSHMISKSLPPIRYVKLVHNANGETCKATVKETLNLDITGLAYKQEKGSEIMLNIEGLTEPIKYVYE